MGRRVAPEKQDGFSYTFAYVHIITSDVVFETKVLGLRRLEDNNKVLVLVLRPRVLGLGLGSRSLGLGLDKKVLTTFKTDSLGL